MGEQRPHLIFELGLVLLLLLESGGELLHLSLESVVVSGLLLTDALEFCGGFGCKGGHVLVHGLDFVLYGLEVGLDKLMKFSTYGSEEIVLEVDGGSGSGAGLGGFLAVVHGVHRVGVAGFFLFWLCAGVRCTGYILLCCSAVGDGG